MTSASDLMDKAPSVDEVLREVSRIRNIVTDAVEDGVKSAVSAINQSRQSAEDAFDQAKYHVRRKPVEAMGVVFAAGILTGVVFAWMSSRRS